MTVCRDCVKADETSADQIFTIKASTRTVPLCPASLTTMRKGLLQQFSQLEKKVPKHWLYIYMYIYIQIGTGSGKSSCVGSAVGSHFSERIRTGIEFPPLNVVAHFEMSIISHLLSERDKLAPALSVSFYCCQQNTSSFGIWGENWISLTRLWSFWRENCLKMWGCRWNDYPRTV